MKFLISEEQFKYIVDNVRNHYELNFLNEGRNEEEALRILKNRGVEDESAVEIINYLKKIDKSKNNKVLPVMVSFYVHTDQYNEIVSTFNKIFQLKNPPDIILQGEQVKLLGNEFSIYDFNAFKNFIDHKFYEPEEDDEIQKKLVSVEENIVFENEKFIVYEAPSAEVCIKLFGREYEGRKYPERGYCLGWGTPDVPAGHYHGHRTSEGKWRFTPYIVVDKEKLKNFYERSEDDVNLMNVIGVRDIKKADDDLHGNSVTIDGYEYMVWNRTNPGHGIETQQAEQYLANLQSNGLNISVLKPKKYIDIRDTAIESMVSNPDSDTKFFALTPKQKIKYITEKAKTLTREQMAFVLKQMPGNIIEFFINNHSKLGNLNLDSFELLNPKQKETYIRSKLIQLFSSNNNFDKQHFLTVVSMDQKLVKFAEKMLMFHLTEKRNENQNVDESESILSLIVPERMFEMQRGKTSVVIDKNNFAAAEFNEDFGDYLIEAEELEIKGISITKLPSSIGKCKNLKSIHIYDCYRLKELPEELTNLYNLSDLVVSNCALERIPESIGNLKNLYNLTLYNNDIVRIPLSLKNCTNLAMLKLEENRISDIDRNIFVKEGVNIESPEDATSEDITMPDLVLIGLEDNQLVGEDTDLLDFISSTGVHVAY